MSRRTQIVLTDEQYEFLHRESDRTGLPVAALIRRAVDHTYRPGERPRLKGFDISFGIWGNPDAAVVGRRAGIR